jgi:rubrerythrin
MQLGTFGAILSYAIEAEGWAETFYERAAAGELTDLFAPLAKSSAKRKRRLLRARQELVSEMILESIEGLDSESYAVRLDSDQDGGGALAQAVRLETMLAAFYRDAAAKMPIREVVRLFARLAEENDRRGDQITAWGQSIDS